MALEDINIRRCGHCGKLFRLQQGLSHCLECAASADEDADAAVPSREELRELGKSLLRDQNFSEIGGEVDNVCVRCKSYPKIEDSEFCLKCQVDLVAELGDAADELFVSMEMLDGQYLSAPHDVKSAYEEKRLRAPYSRINPISVGRLKT